MKFRRDLIIVALATFCLTSTLFMTLTSRSADSPNWDPWADLKEDGTVDIYDAITLANAYGSSGDTTKNVNVTNWPDLLNVTISNYCDGLILGRKALNVSLGSGVLYSPSERWYSDSVVVDCYTQYLLYLNFTGGASLIVEFRFITGGLELTGETVQVGAPHYILAGPYAVKGAAMRILVYEAPGGGDTDYFNAALYVFNA